MLNTIRKRLTRFLRDCRVEAGNLHKTERFSLPDCNSITLLYFRYGSHLNGRHSKRLAHRIIVVSRIFSSLLLFALLVVHPLVGMSAEVAEKKLSLDDCIEIALKNATSVKKAEYSLKLQGSDVLKSYGSFLPKLSLSASYTPYALNRSYTIQNGSYNKTESESLDFAIITSLNLFNGFRDYASLQSSLDKREAARYTLERALQSVVFDVTQTYFQVLLNRELLDISRENLLVAQDQLTLTNRQYEAGLKSIIDQYQQQSDAAESSLQVIKAESRWQRSLLELLRRLQIDPQTKIILEAAPELKITQVTKPDIDSLVAIALERRSDLKSRNLEAKGAKWQVTEARAQWYPALDLRFIANTAGSDYLRNQYSTPPLSKQLGNSTGYSVALNLNWALFDGFQTNYNVQAAKINHINKALDYTDLKNNLVIDLQQVAGDYASAFIQIESAKVSLTAARSAFEGIKRKYELGAASFIELSLARAALFNARSNLSQATYNLALQKSILDYTTGNISLP